MILTVLFLLHVIYVLVSQKKKLYVLVSHRSLLEIKSIWHDTYEFSTPNIISP